MKTLFKLTFITTISVFIFSCSTPDAEEISLEPIKTNFSNKNSSDLVETTKTFFKNVEENVKSEDDLEYAQNLTKELVSEWVNVMKENNGIEEAKAALKILEETVKTKYQYNKGNDCIKSLRACVRAQLVKLVANLNIFGFGDENHIATALNDIIGCVIDYVTCAFL